MIKMEDIAELHNHLDNLIGDCDTPYFNYLISSSNLIPSEGMKIIEHIKVDIDTGKIINKDEIYSCLKKYFNEKNDRILKEKKINSLDRLFSEDNYFFPDLKKYHLNRKEQNDIKEQLSHDIMASNLSEYELQVQLIT